jgi:MFS family permease
MIVHSVASIPLGILADRWLRPRVVAIGVGLWSVATAAAGLARGYAELFVARAAVGIGEAAYAPAASSLISDRFKPEARARALAIFQLGMLVGTSAGIVAGGVVAEEFGWRAAFFIVGLPGLVLTVLAMMLHDEPRAPRPATVGGPNDHGASALLRSTTPGVRAALVLINVTGILITFFVGAVGLWGIKFLVQYHFAGDTDRVGEATLMFGLIGTLAGVGGAITGSMIADRIERRRPGAGRLLTIAFGVLVGGPCAGLALITDSLLGVAISLTIGVFFISWYVGPVIAALHDVVAPHHRATATGAYLFLVHALGDGISPGVVGIIKDHASLRTGLLISLLPMMVGGLTALAAAPHAIRVAESKRVPASRS